MYPAGNFSWTHWKSSGTIQVYGSEYWLEVEEESLAMHPNTRLYCCKSQVAG